ncbi:MAG TPA: GNAT family N-acetyltransferase [Gaiellaceae bacterium]
MTVTVRRLAVGDEGAVQRLSLDDARFDERSASARPRTPHTIESAREFLASEKTFQLAGFAGGEPVGHLLAYELIRRHGDGKTMLVYEIGVRDDHRRAGVGTALFDELRRICRRRGISRAFVITNESNEPAMDFYRSQGGKRQAADDVVFDFDWP